jgi:hypothetical protein
MLPPRDDPETRAEIEYRIDRIRQERARRWEMPLRWPSRKTVAQHVLATLVFVSYVALLLIIVGSVGLCFFAEGRV